MKTLKTIVAALACGLIGCAAALAGDIDSPTIIGGKESPAGKWPFVVAVEFKTDGVYAQECGGSLIAKTWVLTAAHCIANDAGRQVRFPSNTRIMIGSNDLTKGGRRIQAVKVIKHPNYNPTTMNNDVALIKLAKPVNDITPAAYVSAPTTEATYAAVGKPAYVVGWGDTDPSSRDVYPNKMRELVVPILSRSVCNGPNAYDGDVTTRMICAGYMKGGKDSCQGDSGGPLIVKNAAGTFRLQVGVVSFGTGCAVRNFPGVYARLAVIGPWVTQTIKTQ